MLLIFLVLVIYNNLVLFSIILFYLIANAKFLFLSKKSTFFK